MNVHLQPDLNLKDIHSLCDDIDAQIKKVIPQCDVTVHAEPDE
ncbi:MAG TPA: cation transporter dimerization domain-containing protein [Xylanibacter oryzae]|nr:cation transporter dimerization domain-containing protein [Xylanibacter oryzae]